MKPVHLVLNNNTYKLYALLRLNFWRRFGQTLDPKKCKSLYIF